MSQRILLVEDEIDIRELIKIQLEQLGHEIVAISDGLDAIDIIQDQDFDLFVIDRMLPGSSGIEICKFLRRFNRTKTAPILIVTALARSENVVEGLDAGADDYITKPFDMNILVARVKSLLRRSEFLQKKKIQISEETEVVFGKIRIDTSAYKVFLNGKEIPFTISEYKLLCLLVENSRKVLSRKDLVKYIQGDENVYVTERTIDTHVFGLRKKLGNESAMIETIRGIGYRVNDEY